jgi:chorismate synthase
LHADLTQSIAGAQAPIDAGCDTFADCPRFAPRIARARGCRHGLGMSHNTFGRLFRVTTFGESHGPAIGCVVDGCPPGLGLSEVDIQVDLDRRRPGTSRFVTQRQEPDSVRILSGVFADPRGGPQVTTGTPIALVIDNVDSRSKDYGEIADRYRPGHADYTYAVKYGVRDYRGGGRSSARETAARVAAGAIARKVLGSGVTVRAALVQIGTAAVDRGRWDWTETGRNAFFAPDAAIVPVWEDLVDAARKRGSSLGAIVEVEAVGAPAGLGAPLYGKLDADLAAAMMSINAVKGVEIGDGFAAAAASGEDNADEMRRGPDGRPTFLSNHAGGILGGISTGAPIVLRFAVKPTSSVLIPQRTVSDTGDEVDIRTKGRHDPCVGIRAAPVGEAMMACVLADHLLHHRAQTGR